MKRNNAEEQKVKAEANADAGLGICLEDPHRQNHGKKAKREKESDKRRKHHEQIAAPRGRCPQGLTAKQRMARKLSRLRSGSHLTYGSPFG